MILCIGINGRGLADSAIVAPSAAGSTFNRSGDPTLEHDERGLSLFNPGPSRTPGGLLYEWPYAVPQGLPLPGDWNYRFALEAGAVAGRASRNAARLRDYRDYSDGPALSHLHLGLERPGSAEFLDFTAGAAGREDAHYRATLGRHGDFRVNLSLTRLPRTFTGEARSVFQDAGPGNFTLAPGLVAGNNTPAQVAAALETARPFALGFTRRNAGLDFEATPGAEWRLFAGYQQDRKTGARPFGAAASFPGVPAVELIEPIDYRTHNLVAGAQWVRDALQANLVYSGSFFRNGIDALTWENPLAVGNPAVLQRGRIDLYPDNNFHHLKLDAGAALPWRGRLAGSFALGRMTQDDLLLPPVVNAGILPGAPGIDLANWNTTDALAARSANARIDTRLMHLAGSFSPLTDFTLHARLRRYDEDNRTRYAAFNPLTGQFGHVGNDGALNNIVPGFSRVQLRSVPYEYRKDNYGAEADYRLLRRTSLLVGYEREEIRGQHREYNETAEDRVRIALNNRDLPWATVRLSYENARRAGDNYAFDPNRLFYSSVSLINAPATLAELRKYDVADRRQQVVNARVNFLLAKDMDLAVSGRYLDNDYGAQYGRLGERVTVLNLEWSWVASARTSAYAHYGFQRVRNRMSLISDDPAGWTTGNPNAGGPVYPLTNRWTEDSRDDAHLVGLGFRYAFNHVTVLESGYSWLYSPYRTRYGFASPGALVGGALAAAEAGDGMPDIVFRQQALETSLKVRLSRTTALRLYHRYERATFKDWHYDALPLVFEGGQAIFLGAGPQSYHANVIGVFFQYTPGRTGKNAR